MAYHSNSADDRLRISTSIPSWGGGSAFTIMGWFKWDGSTGSGLKTFFTRYLNDLTGYIWCGIFDSGQVYFENSLGDSITASLSITSDTWYHVTFVYNVVVGAKIYVDAALVGSSGLTGIAGAPDNMDLLGWQASGNRFNGSVAAVKAWNAELTQPQIATEKGFAEPQLLTNLYDYWLLVGTPTAGANGHNWTVIGDPDITADPPITYPSAGAVELSSSATVEILYTSALEVLKNLTSSSPLVITQNSSLEVKKELASIIAISVSTSGSLRVGTQTTSSIASRTVYIGSEDRGEYIQLEDRGVYVS